MRPSSTDTPRGPAGPAAPRRRRPNLASPTTPRIGLGLIVAAAVLVVCACAPARPPTSEFAKTASAILADAQRDYTQSPAVHLVVSSHPTTGPALELNVLIVRAGGGSLTFQAEGQPQPLMQATVVQGKEYLYVSTAYESLPDQPSMPPDQVGRWVLMGQLSPTVSAQLFAGALTDMTQASQVFDQVPPITRSGTEEVRGQRAIAIRWQDDSGVYVTVAVGRSGRLLAWQGATADGTPTFSAQVFTDIAVPTITPPPVPVPYTPTAAEATQGLPRPGSTSCLRPSAPAPPPPTATEAAPLLGLDPPCYPVN